MAGRFAIGSTFNSYSNFEEELGLYKNATFSEFFIKDCRTLEVAKKRYPQRVEKANKDLKYYFVKLMCVNGGNYKKRKTTGERKVSSMRQGCSAYIYVKLSEDGKKLVITDMCENHNHERSQELFNFLPRQRRLAPDVQQEIMEMLQLKVKKKLIQEKYTAETNKKITLRDLSNLQAKVNAVNYNEIIESIQEDDSQSIAYVVEIDDTMVSSIDAVGESQSKNVALVSTPNKKSSARIPKAPKTTRSNTAAEEMAEISRKRKAAIELEMEIKTEEHKMKKAKEERDIAEHTARMKLINAQLKFYDALNNVVRNNPEKITFSLPSSNLLE